jgi:hypothetical protein
MGTSLLETVGESPGRGEKGKHTFMQQSSHSSLLGPVARQAELTVEHLSSETIVYDHRRHRVHCLNRTLAFIWQQCDGHTSPQAIAERLPGALNLPPDQDVVRLALRRLGKADLITDELLDLGLLKGPSRRQLISRFAAMGLAGAALTPALTSVVAPTPAMAASGDTYSDPGNGQGNGRGSGLGEQGDNGHGHRSP